MLLKIERKILQKISKTNAFSIEKTDFPKYSSSSIQKALMSLEAKGYLSQYSASIDLSHFTFELTIQGKYYKEFCFQMFLRDIFVPFVTSVITTLLIEFLSGKIF